MKSGYFIKYRNDNKIHNPQQQEALEYTLIRIELFEKNLCFIKKILIFAMGKENMKFATPNFCP